MIGKNVFIALMALMAIYLFLSIGNMFNSKEVQFCRVAPAQFSAFKSKTTSENNATQQEEEDENTLLEALAAASGTDKYAHNYTALYPQYFAPLRHRPLKFLEIGLFQGKSVRMWEQYFPNAQLHFVDVTYQPTLYNSTRSKYHLIDQTDKQRLRQLGEQWGPFDIIVDDGGHTAHQVISSFEALFVDFLKPAGFYVIEDLHAAYWEGFGGQGKLGYVERHSRTFYNVTGAAAKDNSTMAFLKDLLDEVNYAGAQTGLGSGLAMLEEVREKMSPYAKQIRSMHFYNSICFILRK